MNWAVVTGGSRGIGAAACLALARAGYDIAFTFRRDATARDRLRDQLDALGRRSRADQLDLGDLDAVRSWAQSSAAELSPQILIANAAEAFRGTLAEHDTDVVRRLFDVNVLATLELARQFAAPLAASRAGALVVVSSMNGVRGSGASAGYSSTKAAVLGMTKALAVELAPEVRVNAVIPGIIDTDMNAAALTDPATVITVAASVPLGRAGTSAEVGAVIAWLAGPDASYITGSAVAADGGALSLFPVH